MAAVVFHHEFAAEFPNLERSVRDEISAYVLLLMAAGVGLDRPRAGTLRGSSFSKMKELRLVVTGVEWRVAYAFDDAQVGILLAAGSKNGVNEERFYRTLIATAERRLTAHEAELAARSGATQATTRVKGKQKGNRR